MKFILVVDPISSGLIGTIYIERVDPAANNSHKSKMASSETSSEPPSANSSTPTPTPSTVANKASKIGASAHEKQPVLQRRVEVYARVRPPFESSYRRPSEAPDLPYRVHENDDGIARHLEFVAPRKKVQDVVDNNPNSLVFTFNRVIRPSEGQQSLYGQVVRPTVDSALEGYNNTIFAYGQTGSGKTYTISGGETFPERGIIPRIIEDLYKHIDENHSMHFSILISYFEIYNETIFDLLDRSHRTKPIEEWQKIDMRKDEDGNLELRNLQLFEAKSEREALNLLFLGNVNRMTAETPMNQASSRSHCVFTIHVEQKHEEAETITCSKLHFVDLAGSERVFKTENNIRGDTGSNQMLNKSFSGRPGTASTAHWAKRERNRALTRKEGKSINLSLHYLEQVIIALQQRQRNQSRAKGQAVASYVPYRNSVLTSVLRDSLGGNCRTVFIATLNPEPEFTEESVSTCRFAQRCGMLTSYVAVNKQEDISATVKRLKSQNRKIKSQLNNGIRLLYKLGFSEKAIRHALKHGNLELEGGKQLSLFSRKLHKSDEQACERLVKSFLHKPPHFPSGHVSDVESLNSIEWSSDGVPEWWVRVSDMAQAQLCMALLKRAVFTAINSAEGNKDVLSSNSNDGTAADASSVHSHNQTTSKPRRPSSASSADRGSRTNASFSSHTHRTRGDSSASSDYNDMTPAGRHHDEETASQSTIQSERNGSGHFPIQTEPLRENAKPVIQTVDDPTASATAVDTEYNTNLDVKHRNQETRSPARSTSGQQNSEEDSRVKAMRSLLLKGAAFWIHETDNTHARFVWCSQNLGLFFIGAVNSSRVYTQIPSRACLDVYPGRQTDHSWKNNFACFTVVYESGGEWHYLELELDDRDVREFSRGYTVESIQSSTERARKTIEAARNIWIEAFRLAIKLHGPDSYGITGSKRHDGSS
eukprot:gb/GECG01014660.1/.p1 GENE.gb/GECG01014660.1/~~gb/GECG01014660.1/.p1  ORF type:complete len:934 (+),score=99.95 gb/GECG01014660.1/:1-2802(+)